MEASQRGSECNVVGAIAADGVDFVLPPAAIARQLVTLARHSYVTLEPVKAIEAPGEPDAAFSNPACGRAGHPQPLLSRT